MTPPERVFWRHVAPQTLYRLLDADEYAFARRGASWYVGTVYPSCERPIAMFMWCRTTYRDYWRRRKVITVDPEHGRDGVTVAEIAVPCRQCPQCVEIRRHSWIKRMLHEVEMASASYMVTLTLSTPARVQLRNECVARFGTMPPTSEERCLHVYKWVQLYLKRLRKNTGATLRYCAITEKHKDGTPHIHLLIHGDVSRQSILGTKWGHGFRDCRIVRSDGAVRYLAKYLSKDALAVRASRQYGPLAVEAKARAGLELNATRKSSKASPKGDAWQLTQDSQSDDRHEQGEFRFER